MPIHILNKKESVGKTMKSSMPEAYGYLRFFHGLCLPASYDLYLDEKCLIKDFLFKDFTHYSPLPAGEHTLMLCSHHDKEPLFTQNLIIREQRIYTLVLYGQPNLQLADEKATHTQVSPPKETSAPPTTIRYSAHLLVEPPKPIPEEHFLLRVANFISPLPDIHLELVDTRPVFKKLPFLTTSAYLAFLPRTYTLQLHALLEDKILCEKAEVTLKWGRYYTLYLVGTLAQPACCLTIDGNAFLSF